MQENNYYGNSLLVIIADKGKCSAILDYVLTLGIYGATAFRARGTAPNRILRFFELVKVSKEIIIIALPTSYEQEILKQLIDRFHFDCPNKGTIFTLHLSAVYGSKYLDHEPSKAREQVKYSPFQAVLTIVDKGRADSILDFVEEQGFPRGIIIDAHGVAGRSNVILNLKLEPEKEIILTITTRSQAQRLAALFTEYLNLLSANSGILAIMNIKQLVVSDPTLTTIGTKDESESAKKMPSYSAILVIVNNDMDEAVIKSANLVGATGGTTIHARGSCAYHEKSSFCGSIRPEREIVLIISEDDRIEAICNRINEDLQLDQSGKGILLVLPLYDAIGLVPGKNV
jgi:nitrogen regulatory protein PII